MKQFFYFVAALLVSVSHAGAQSNLVPNPSFEDTISIPCGILLPGQFNGAVQNWSAPTQGATTLYSTELDPSCYNFMPHSSYPGPIGLKGTEMPLTGNVMAGIFCYTISGLNQRQYLQVRLSSPLVPMETYEVSFHASLADYTEFATPNLGAHLSETPIGSQNDQPLAGYTPQVSAMTAIADTAGWTLITGVITADAPWEYLTIGNFLNDSQTSTQPNPGGGACVSCYGAYYYIDDVSVSHLVTDLKPNHTTWRIQVSPQPATDYLHILTDAPNEMMLRVYDVLGQEVYSSCLLHEGYLDLRFWNAGTYIYEIQDSDKHVVRGRFLHFTNQ